jgi:putative transcriptional regulator
MVKKTKPSRLAKALLETADDMHRVGVMDDATHQKITLRHLGDKAAGKDEPITATDILELRERAHLSQAVFARYLNLTTGYVSQLERGSPHEALGAGPVIPQEVATELDPTGQFGEPSLSTPMTRKSRSGEKSRSWVTSASAPIASALAA